jgi:hypothetical protein
VWFLRLIICPQEVSAYCKSVVSIFDEKKYIKKIPIVKKLCVACTVVIFAYQTWNLNRLS